jgi:hypothetical protein
VTIWSAPRRAVLYEISARAPPRQCARKRPSPGSVNSRAVDAAPSVGEATYASVAAAGREDTVWAGPPTSSLPQAARARPVKLAAKNTVAACRVAIRTHTTPDAHVRSLKPNDWAEALADMDEARRDPVARYLEIEHLHELGKPPPWLRTDKPWTSERSSARPCTAASSPACASTTSRADGRARPPGRSGSNDDGAYRARRSATAPGWRRHASASIPSNGTSPASVRAAGTGSRVAGYRRPPSERAQMTQGWCQRVLSVHLSRNLS